MLLNTFGFNIKTLKEAPVPVADLETETQRSSRIAQLFNESAIALPPECVLMGSVEQRPFLRGCGTEWLGQHRTLFRCHCCLCVHVGHL